MAWETEVAIDVDADAAAVWSVLTDFDAYPEWNPTLTAVRGTPELGERLSVRLAVGDAFSIPFRPTVTVVDPGAELRWESRPGPEDLFVAEQGFLVREGDDGVRFVQRGRFEGPLAEPTMGHIGGRVRTALHEMNDALARRAEREATA